jgi:hypothetical protein
MATMKHLSLCLMLLCLAACGDNSTPPARIPTNNWVMSYSQGTALSVAAGELWQFDFPAYPGHVNMVTKSTGALTGQQLTAVFEEDESGPIWFWAFDAGNTCNPGSPPQTHLYFQRAGDDMSGVGGMQYYRWWSRGIDISGIKHGDHRVGPKCLDERFWSARHCKSDDVCGGTRQRRQCWSGVWWRLLRRSRRGSEGRFCNFQAQEFSVRTK